MRMIMTTHRLPITKRPRALTLMSSPFIPSFIKAGDVVMLGSRCFRVAPSWSAEAPYAGAICQRDKLEACGKPQPLMHHMALL